MLKILQPPGWAEPKGYANGVAARGAFVAIGGQIGWNAAQAFETDDFAAQARQALANIVAVLAEAGGRPEHIVRMTWYVVDRDEYLASLRALGRAYRELIGRQSQTWVRFPDLGWKVVSAHVSTMNEASLG